MSCCGVFRGTISVPQNCTQHCPVPATPQDPILWREACRVFMQILISSRPGAPSSRILNSFNLGKGTSVEGMSNSDLPSALSSSFSSPPLMALWTVQLQLDPQDWRLQESLPSAMGPLATLSHAHTQRYAPKQSLSQQIRELSSFRSIAQSFNCKLLGFGGIRQQNQTSAYLGQPWQMLYPRTLTGDPYMPVSFSGCLPGNKDTTSFLLLLV